MHDSTLLRGALFISLIGIIALYFLQNNLQPALEKSNEWNEQTIGKTVRTTGIVEKSWTKNNNAWTLSSEGKPPRNRTMLIINQSCKIQVILPKEAEIPPGMEVEIVGKYNEYAGKQEIQASTIRMIKK